MNEFKKAKEDYESTPIPQELGSRVRAGIRLSGPFYDISKTRSSKENCVDKEECVGYNKDIKGGPASRRLDPC